MSTYVSGLCGARHHTACHGQYAGATCVCTCHLAPRLLEHVAAQAHQLHQTLLGLDDRARLVAVERLLADVLALRQAVKVAATGELVGATR